MIVSIRIDDRLIHGQVALVWTKEYGTQHIVVANDEAAENNILKSSLKMACPTGIKLLVKNVKESIDVFNSDIAKDKNLFVLVRNVHDAMLISKKCTVGSVNVANVGRFDESEGERIHLTSSVVLTKSEYEDLKELVKCDCEVFSQVIPTNPKTSVEKLLEKNGGK